LPTECLATFELQIVAKGETRLDGFDDKIISLYARGMTVREIQGHLRELYAVDVSPDLISWVTDAVLDEVREWQNRPLDVVCLVVFFDALWVKIRDESVGQVQGRLPRPGARLRGSQARLGPLDRAERGRQVLVAGHDGSRTAASRTSCLPWSMG
jgi:putative transposase